MKMEIYEQYRKEGYKNTYTDPKPDHDCDVDVIDHEGNRFRTRLYLNEFGHWVYDSTKGRGYDICWWKEVKEKKVNNKGYGLLEILLIVLIIAGIALWLMRYKGVI